MATRLYLPASGTPAITPTPSTSWNVTTGFAALPTSTTKSNTALAAGTARSHPLVAVQNALDRVYVSDTLDSSQGINGTFSAVVRGIQSSTAGNWWLNIILRVVSGDGSIETGVLHPGSAATSAVATVGDEAEELVSATAATRIKNALSLIPVTANAGDRILIEVGGRADAAGQTARTYTLNYGDPTATADYALTSGLTTLLDPWVEFSQTITFGTPAPNAVTGQNFFPDRAAIRRASIW